MTKVFKEHQLRIEIRTRKHFVEIETQLQWQFFVFDLKTNFCLSKQRVYNRNESHPEKEPLRIASYTIASDIETRRKREVDLLRAWNRI